VPHLQTAVVHAPDQVVVRVAGDVDTVTTPRLTRLLREAAGRRRGAVVVDVAGARFRDCSGLQVLAGFTEALGQAGRHCRIVGAPAVTRRLVHSAGFGGRLELDGPVDAGDPDPAAAPPAPRTPYRVRPARCAEEQPARRRLRPGSVRRWR
jgi:anti-anti-sigma factor